MAGGVDPNDANRSWSTPAPTGGAPAYFRSNLHLDFAPQIGMVYRLSTDGLSFGCVWLNGHNLGLYPEIIQTCPGLWLPSCWLKQGDNQLVFFDEQGKSPERTLVRLEPAASRHELTIGPE